MPDLPPVVAAAPKKLDVASLPVLTLRSGAYANFTRLVFDWNKDVPYTVSPGAGRMTIKFQAAAKPDLSAIARFQPPWVKNAAWHLEGSDTVVEFETDADSGYHDFKDGTKIVLDILAPKTDASAYAPPGTAKPHNKNRQPQSSPAPVRPRLPPSPPPPSSFRLRPRTPNLIPSRRRLRPRPMPKRMPKSRPRRRNRFCPSPIPRQPQQALRPPSLAFRWRLQPPQPPQHKPRRAPRLPQLKSRKAPSRPPG